jgi:hypothetical protein
MDRVEISVSESSSVDITFGLRGKLHASRINLQINFGLKVKLHLVFGVFRDFRMKKLQVPVVNCNFSSMADFTTWHFDCRLKNKQPYNSRC